MDSGHGLIVVDLQTPLKQLHRLQWSGRRHQNWKSFVAGGCLKLADQAKTQQFSMVQHFKQVRAFFEDPLQSHVCLKDSE